MSNTFELCARAVAIVLTTVAMTLTCAAQSYPSHPVQVIVSYPPGGTGDFVARTISDKLASALGQPVNIENRPGASGAIGARSVARATPDGYTLLIGQAAEIAINKISVVDLGYNPERDLQPVALLTIMPMGLVVPTTAPYSTVGELVKASRAAPRGLTFASAGAGTPGHFAGEILRLRTGGRFTHVPFDGAAPALEGLIAGRVDFYFASLLAAQEPVKAGKLKMIAVSSAQRVLAAPTVPTVMESGIPNFNMTQWVTLLAPRGTPKPVVDRLNREVNQVLALPEVRERLLSAGADITPMSPDQVRAFVKSETDRYSTLIEEEFCSRFWFGGCTGYAVVD
jgi:tripartite-type tricarboxylate transporter receptor subunit TctC